MFFSYDLLAELIVLTNFRACCKLSYSSSFKLAFAPDPGLLNGVNSWSSVANSSFSLPELAFRMVFSISCFSCL